MPAGERPVLTCGDRRFPLGARTYVMGIVNVTPDSFSDGGRFVDVDAAVAHGLRLLEEGADVLDIGGESTRPGAPPVDPVEERRRVLPVIEALAARGVRCLSVDTRRAGVADEALARGAAWINDTEGLQGEGMPSVARGADAVVIMHWRRSGFDAKEDHVRYDDVVSEVRGELAARVRHAVSAGVDAGRILVDPGIGFGKRIEDNLALTRGLAGLRGDAAGVLYGPSRKRFLGVLAGVDAAADRDAATVGAVSFAAAHGADFVRVHDVAHAVQALRVVDALLGRGPTASGATRAGAT